MKKIVSLSVLIASVLLFIWLKYYTESSVYNYHVAYFAEYLFYWSVALFILSLFAFVLNNLKYKIWFLITILFIILSTFVAYSTDGHDVLFNGQYVVLLFIGLYSLVSIIFLIVQFLNNRKQLTLVK